MELDKDTKKVIDDGQKMTDFVENDGWKLVKKKLFDKLITFDSISSVPKDKKSMEEIGKEAVLREAVVEIIIQWIQEIEGKVSQHKNNRKVIEEIRKESIIQYFE